MGVVTMDDTFTSLKKRFSELYRKTNVQRIDLRLAAPGYPDKEYTRGFTNGLICAVAIMQDKEPRYIEPGADDINLTEEVAVKPYVPDNTCDAQATCSIGSLATEPDNSWQDRQLRVDAMNFAVRLAEHGSMQIFDVQPLAEDFYKYLKG